MQELDPLQRHLQEKLTGKRFLLVLDDVWNEDHGNWEELKKALIHGAKGSTVLVTTCNEVVARMMTTVPIHHLGFLSDDDSWSLFKQRVLLFSMGKHEDCAQFEALGKEIVKKCGGVPLAVKVLGSFMCYREKESDWVSIKESKMWEMPNVGSTVLEVLRLSYENMKPHLRQCFAFCSIFPKGSIMRRDKLIQLWMANGFIPSVGQVNLHDAGCEIFNELTWRSFLQEIKEDLEGNVTCKMHDLIHDLAQSIMGSECCVIEPTQPELKVTKTVRHVFASGNSSEIATANVHKLANVKSLRSLIVHNNFFSKIATKQKHLKALEFQLDGKMKISIGNFRHLRYLNLTHPCIMTLPESVSSLHNLQTLNLRCSRLRTLPKGLKHLKNLIYLDIKGCHELTCMPSGLGQLSCLRILSKFIVGNKSGCYIDELRGLALEGELCIEELDHVKCLRDAQSANLSMKQNLRSVSLHWRKKNDGDKLQNADDHQEVLTGLQPHPNLKKLSIRNFHGPRFSNWLMDPLVPKLVEISLVNCERCECLPPFGKLVFLKVLTISGMDALKSVDNSFYGDGQSSFPSLERLSFRGMPCLEEWTTSRESFASLRSLIIGHCPKLVELPIFPSLKTLQIEENCSVSLLTSVKHYTSLNSLWIGSFHDQLPTLPDGLLQNHNQLEELYIHLRKLNSLSNLLDNLSGLKRLDLQMCQDLQSLPAGLKNLSSLKSLHLSDCDSLDTLPENGLQGLSSLNSLWVQNCKNLVSLSNGVSHLASLRDLFIFSCPKLISLPDSIQHLSAVRSLKIWDCEGLTCLPNEIEHLSSLSLLEIRRCPNLTSLPRGLQSLKDLRNLTIIGCPHVERWYKKEKGNDSSSYIAHIPSIRIMSSEKFSKRRRSSGKLLLC